MKHRIDDILQRVYGLSDEDILREFEAARAEVEAECKGQDNMCGFDRLWRRLAEEQEKSSRL